MDLVLEKKIKIKNPTLTVVSDYGKVFRIILKNFEMQSLFFSSWEKSAIGHF